ncbi:MAG: LacI family DNA-binding transcriptional regulator [Eubacteriales bacterium]|nr:LacI family DNA-binding transcriptional regulator [Eubacteriales bacterium]
MGEGRERVTRADVARLAGVSETIVSYVINNNRYVAKEKRRRVEEAVRALNYRPNSMARALKGKQSNQILFIADHITNEYFARIVSEMDQYAYNAGFLISLCANRNTPEFVSQVISRQYDGIIVSSASFPDEYVQQFSQAGIPVVVFRRFRHQSDPYQKLPDQELSNGQMPDRVAVLGTGLYTGARQAVKHLIEKGCRHIIYADRISARGHVSRLDDLRLCGFVDEMQAHGLSAGPESMICGCHTEEELAQAVTRRLQSGEQIDGIFGRNDMIACAAMTAAQQCGFSVPEDIQVVGFDDSSISRYCSPKLTTIRVDQTSIAKTTIDMLTEMINGINPGNVDFESILVKRESTRRE